MLLLEVVTMIRIIPTPETFQCLLDYVDVDRDEILKLFSTVSTWGRLSYPVVTGDEESEYIESWVERASSVLEAIAKHEEIYFGTVHYCGTYMVIVEHAVDYLKMMSIERKVPSVEIPLSIPVMLQVDIIARCESDGVALAAGYVERVALDAIDCIINQRDSDQEHVQVLIYHWNYMRNEFKEVVTTDAYDYTLTYSPQQVVLFTVQLKGNPD